LFSRIDIGVRYYLPAYPFLFILGGALLASLLKSRKAARAGMLVAIGLLAWIGIEAVRAFPDHMSYLNQFAAGKPHWWYLSDSNVEWGDDIPALAAYLRARGETRVRANFLGDFGERGFGLALLIPAEELPLREIDSIKKMEAMPALFWNKPRILIGHRASVRCAQGRSSRRDLGLGQMRQAIFFAVTGNAKLQVRIAQLGRAANGAVM